MHDIREISRSRRSNGYRFPENGPTVLERLALSVRSIRCTVCRDQLLDWTLNIRVTVEELALLLQTLRLEKP